MFIHKDLIDDVRSRYTSQTHVRDPTVIVFASFRPFAFLRTGASAKKRTLNKQLSFVDLGTHHLDFDCAVCLASLGKHISRPLAKIPQFNSFVVLLEKKDYLFL